MELLHVDQANPVPQHAARTVKKLFGEVWDQGDFDELVSKFVFYSPMVHYLIGDTARTGLSTDPISHSLARHMQEHPLVITDLSRPVFRFDETMIVQPELKSLARTLYAVPKEVWDQTLSELRMLTVFDLSTSRFCVLTPYERTIPSPLGKHAENNLPVQYFNCYGNREMYLFMDGGIETPMEDGRIESSRPPRLRFLPPVREFVDLADIVLAKMLERGGTPFEQAVQDAAEQTERTESRMLPLEIRQGNELKMAPPLNESLTNDEYNRECRRIIRFYESVFGVATG